MMVCPQCDTIIDQDPAIDVHWGNVAAGEGTDLTDINKVFINLLKAGLISIPDESVQVVQKPATKVRILSLSYKFSYSFTVKTKKRSASKKDHRQPDDSNVDERSSELSDLPPDDDKSNDDDDDSDEDDENGMKMKTSAKVVCTDKSGRERDEREEIRTVQQNKH
ncbi:hypothetical protein R3P38DRAFT_2757471 [Favolaschia claudopus]|uniref:Uncharacterized protein n=1 Tax=Favolaschia claudopus TaxID=2862362 RepID=A0AAW0EHF8_9AGAR